MSRTDAKVERGADAMPRLARKVALGLLGVAVLLGLWLTWASSQSGPVPGCDGAGCGTVLSSRWARWFGVPVGLLGAAVYGVLILLGSRPWSRMDLATRRAAALLVGMVPMAALWFGWVQLGILRAFCPWCTATHCVATVGALMLAWTWRQEPEVSAGGKRRVARAVVTGSVWGPALGAAAVVTAGFIGLQAISPEPERPRLVTASMGSGATQTNSGTGTVASVAISAGGEGGAGGSPLAATVVTGMAAEDGARLLVLHDGRFTLDPRDVPILGSPEAGTRVVMLSDYTCRYCRNAYQLLPTVRAAFGADRLAILMLPRTFNREAREIQQLALASWKLDPTFWAALSEDLYLERMPAKADAVRARMEARWGVAGVRQALEAEAGWISGLMQLGEEVHAANRARAGSGSIPQLIIGQEIVVGAPADAAEVFQLLAQHAGLVRERLPELRLVEPVRDVGRVFAGTQVPVGIEVVNRGNADLRVSRIVVPPGGRVAAGVNVPVAPGSKGLMQVLLPVPAVEGDFSQELLLHNDGAQSVVSATVKGTSWKPLRVTPTALDFGFLDLGQTSTQGVLRVELDMDVALAGVRSGNPGFSAVLREVTPLRVYEVEVTTTPALGRGPQQGSVVLTLASPVPEGWPESLALGVRARVEPAVASVPARILLPAGPLTAERHHQVMVRCQDGWEGFEVTGAVLDGGPAFLLPQVLPSSASNVVVQFTLPAGWSPPEGLEGGGQARLLVHTTHPRYGTVEIPLVVRPQ